MTEPPGYKPLVVNVVVVGPFEEEEEGTGVASDVVKVEGGDPDQAFWQKCGNDRAFFLVGCVKKWRGA